VSQRDCWSWQPTTSRPGMRQRGDESAALRPMPTVLLGAVTTVGLWQAVRVSARRSHELWAVLASSISMTTTLLSVAAVSRCEVRGADRGKWRSACERAFWMQSGMEDPVARARPRIIRVHSVFGRCLRGEPLPRRKLSVYCAAFPNADLSCPPPTLGPAWWGI
jgi:hypothetical protein